jgi:hypothetical protein
MTTGATRGGGQCLPVEFNCLTGSPAGVAKLADAQDLKSWVAQAACGFDSRPRHLRVNGLAGLFGSQAVGRNSLYATFMLRSAQIDRRTRQDPPGTTISRATSYGRWTNPSEIPPVSPTTKPPMPSSCTGQVCCLSSNRTPAMPRGQLAGVASLPPPADAGDRESECRFKKETSCSKHACQELRFTAGSGFDRRFPSVALDEGRRSGVNQHGDEHSRPQRHPC